MNLHQYSQHFTLFLLFMIELLAHSSDSPGAEAYRTSTAGERAERRRFHPKRYHHIHNRYRPKRYQLTLSIRNHNVTEARFFRLIGVDNTVDFYVAPGKTFTNTYEVNRKGYWTLFVEFPGDRYAKSPRKIISRDSYAHWIMEVYFYPASVGFSEWHKMHRLHFE